MPSIQKKKKLVLDLLLNSTHTINRRFFMNKTKKFLMLGLMLALIVPVAFFVTACGGGDDSGGNPPQDTTVHTSVGNFVTAFNAATNWSFTGNVEGTFGFSRNNNIIRGVFGTGIHTQTVFFENRGSNTARYFWQEGGTQWFYYDETVGANWVNDVTRLNEIITPLAAVTWAEASSPANTRVFTGTFESEAVTATITAGQMSVVLTGTTQGYTFTIGGVGALTLPTGAIPGDLPSGGGGDYTPTADSILGVWRGGFDDGDGLVNIRLEFAGNNISIYIDDVLAADGTFVFAIVTRTVWRLTVATGDAEFDGAWEVEFFAYDDIDLITPDGGQTIMMRKD